jgi:hypothetical protein
LLALKVYEMGWLSDQCPNKNQTFLYIRYIPALPLAFLYDIVFDKIAGRHRLEFVNQQYDYLMGIVYNETTGRYELGVSEYEARRISREWGRA